MEHSNEEVDEPRSNRAPKKGAMLPKYAFPLMLMAACGFSEKPVQAANPEDPAMVQVDTASFEPIQSIHELNASETSLTRTIELYGGDASFSKRKDLFAGMEGEGEEYVGSSEQNFRLLLRLKEQLRLGGSYWDLASNSIKKIETESDLERMIQETTALDLNGVTDNNRLFVLESIRQYMTVHPGEQVPIDLMNQIMNCESGNMITIDDGPNEHTLEILDLLKAADETAIFYLVGDHIKEYPEHVKRIVEEGHILGYHSMDHRKQPFSEQELEEDYKAFSEVLNEALGYDYPLVFVRLPYGMLASYRSYTEAKTITGSELSKSVYLTTGNGRQRENNWDVQDNKFRGEGWSLSEEGLSGKKQYYRDNFLEGEGRVFLLHQEGDDVETLRAMLD